MLRQLAAVLGCVGVLVACQGSPEAPAFDDDLADHASSSDTELPPPEEPKDSDPPVAAVDAGSTKVVHQPLLKAGLHPDASDALRKAGVTATMIVQTIGTAAASAGTHAQDGVVDGKPYSAATDISAKSMTDAQITKLLDELGALGFAAWYRKPGLDGWYTQVAPHIHIVWAACKMKSSLRDQMQDFFLGKNGLVSHTKYTFFTWPQSSIDFVRSQYLQYNPASG